MTAEQNKSYAEKNEEHIEHAIELIGLKINSPKITRIRRIKLKRRSISSVCRLYVEYISLLLSSMQRSAAKNSDRLQ